MLELCTQQQKLFHFVFVCLSVNIIGILFGHFLTGNTISKEINAKKNWFLTFESLIALRWSIYCIRSYSLLLMMLLLLPLLLWNETVHARKKDFVSKKKTHTWKQSKLATFEKFQISWALGILSALQRINVCIGRN